MRFDYHMHTPLCHHAEGHPSEYVAVAKKRGLDEIGFADHNPMPEQFDDWRMGPDELPKYIQLVDEARLVHPDFKIRLGLECDYIKGYESHIKDLASQYPFDYFIGSVHYIQEDWDVDNPHKLSRWNDYAVEDVWKMYFACYRDAASSGLFDFLGHPDLVKKFARCPHGDLKSYYREALDAIADCRMTIEINTAGWYKDIKESYPSLAFLEEAFEREIPILINSDAHKPDEVGRDFVKAAKLAWSLGYREITQFVQRESISVPLSI
ncbi:MAG: histidinol-phosphatase HisJ family protein [Verrucomicrobiota bacterium]